MTSVSVSRKTPRGPVLQLSRTLTFVLLVAFVAEATIGSSGRWLMFGPLSVRMLLFLGCLLVALPLLWAERSYLLRRGVLWLTVAFMAVLGVSALWGAHLGNPKGFIVADITALSALLLIPAVLALRLSRAEVDRLCSVLLWSAVALAAATVLLHLLVPAGLVDANALAQWLTERSLGGLADVGHGIQRIYLRSQVLFIPALMIALSRLAADRDRRLPMVGAASVLTMGLILSLTRALWLGLGAAVIVLLIWQARDLKRLLRAGALALLGLLLLLLISMGAYRGPALVVAAAERLSPSLVVVMPAEAKPAPGGQEQGGSKTPSPSPTPPDNGHTPKPPGSLTDDPDAAAVLIRAQTLELSRQLIRERPVTGWGLGHNLDEIRTDGRTEYMYWDLLMKLGIPGLLVFLALYAWTPVRSALRRTRFEPVITLGASLAGIAVTSYFNPYLNSTLGIVVLVMLVGAAAADREAAATDAPTQVT